MVRPALGGSCAAASATTASALFGTTVTIDTLTCVDSCVDTGGSAVAPPGPPALRPAPSNGYSGSAGRLEVQYSGIWGTVCDDYFGYTDAVVACRELGFGTPRQSRYQYDAGGGFGNILMDDIECTGTENFLSECAHSEWGNHNCAHSEVCSGIEFRCSPWW